MSAKVSIGGEHCEMALNLEKWQRVDPGDEHAWIAATVELRANSIGDFEATRDAIFAIGELDAFRNELAALLDSLTGEARLPTLDPSLGIHVSLVLGRGEISLFVRELPGAKLSVEAPTDQSYLQATLRQLDEALVEFSSPD